MIKRMKGPKCSVEAVEALGAGSRPFGGQLLRKHFDVFFLMLSTSKNFARGRGDGFSLVLWVLRRCLTASETFLLSFRICCWREVRRTVGERSVGK